MTSRQRARDKKRTREPSSGVSASSSRRRPNPQTGGSQYQQTDDSQYQQTGGYQYPQTDNSQYSQTGNFQYSSFQYPPYDALQMPMAPPSRSSMTSARQNPEYSFPSMNQATFVGNTQYSGSGNSDVPPNQAQSWDDTSLYGIDHSNVPINQAQSWGDTQYFGGDPLSLADPSGFTDPLQFSTQMPDFHQPSLPPTVGVPRNPITDQQPFYDSEFGRFPDALPQSGYVNHATTAPGKSSVRRQPALASPHPLPDNQSAAPQPRQQRNYAALTADDENDMIYRYRNGERWEDIIQEFDMAPKDLPGYFKKLHDRKNLNPNKSHELYKQAQKNMYKKKSQPKQNVDASRRQCMEAEYISEQLSTPGRRGIFVPMTVDQERVEEPRDPKRRTRGRYPVPLSEKEGDKLLKDFRHGKPLHEISKELHIGHDRLLKDLEEIHVRKNIDPEESQAVREQAKKENEDTKRARDEQAHQEKHYKTFRLRSDPDESERQRRQVEYETQPVHKSRKTHHPKNERSQRS